MTRFRQPLKIRQLTRSDLDFVGRLRASAGWNQTRQDLACLLECQPEGCFLAQSGDDSVGVVTTTSNGTQLAWVGMMLVHPDFRRRGIGTELMRTCLDYLKHEGVRCIKLDASAAGKPLYESLGFQPEFDVHRWERDGGGSSIERTPNGPESLDFGLDNQVFGADRSRLLGSFARRSRIVTRHDGGTPAGYGMMRSGAQAAYIGPIVARDSDTGTAIATELVERETTRLFWDIPEVCREAAWLAESSGFRIVRSLKRMWLGDRLIIGQPQLQFGIGDLATG